jgi:Uma2 family endonuclease
MALTDRSPTPDSAELTPRSRWHGTRMTLDEFLALPEEETALEFDDGLVTQKVAPQADHGKVAARFVVTFAQTGEDRQLGLVFAETRFVTPGWAPVPDVSYYRRERVQPRSRDRLGDFHIPPDIAVEIVSPDQTIRELLEKCLRFAEVGVAVSLVVDTDDRSIYVIRPGQPLRVLRGDDRIDLDDVLPGIELTVRTLFQSVVPDWLTGSSE